MANSELIDVNSESEDEGECSDDDFVPELVALEDRPSYSSSEDEEEEPEPVLVRRIKKAPAEGEAKRAESDHKEVARALISKNGTVWSSEPKASSSKSPFRGIRRGYGRPKTNIAPSTPCEALKLFISEDMVHEIIKETNREAELKISLKHCKDLESNQNAVKGV